MDDNSEKKFNECSTRAVAKGLAVFCIGFSVTYLIQKSRNMAKSRPFVLPSVMGCIVGFEALRHSMSKCRQISRQ
ncbi:unnamed protein product [Medioppia subpectinata]|uniref:Uncharacterized protein n=1 Tax=Medioppia subpectinata TaxID=1979941 RepID=A0A7R9PTD9_9ACAR|nr:unnamed protein product [Medioppia subpectinata]CAG2100518.1 unnamed protein product [Medioppia subpectinata]